MTEEAQKATTQEVAPTTLEVPSGEGAQAAAQEANESKPELDVQVLVKEREEAKREAQKLRTALRAKEAAEAEAAKAQMSEQEKLHAEVAELRKQAETWASEKKAILAESVARDAAEKLGIIDYRDALALTPKDDIVYDDDGRPENLESLFTMLVKSKPYLVSGDSRQVKTVTANASAGTSGGPTVRLSADELEQAKRAGITPERWVALKAVKTLDDWKKTRAQS
jgi:hypothetical protein